MRQKPIQQGSCAAKCCEKFNMRFCNEDFDLMKKAKEEGKTEFIDIRGCSQLVVNDDNFDQIIEMLIPLGRVDYDPQLNEKKLDILSEEEFAKYKEKHQSMLAYLKDTGIYVNEETGQLEYAIYTCKNFDTEKRICKIYETRPHMCRSFGTKVQCKYEGCTLKASISF